LRLLAAGVRGHRRAAWRIAGWSVLEAGPAAACGWVTAAALDRGFLRGSTGTGLAWLALLGALYVVRAVASRGVFADLAEVVEDLRDLLVRRVVAGALGRAVAGGPAVGAAEVSRLGAQADAARGTVAALLRTARPLAVTLVATVLGLAALSPELSALVLAPLAVSTVAFAVSMRALTARRRTQVLAEEEVAARGGRLLGGLRDVAALGAEPVAAAEATRAIEASAAAGLAVARAAAWRVPLVLVGGYVPLLLLLAVGPGLVRGGTVTAGALVGAATYVTANLVPALRMMTGTVAGLWTQLRIVLDRLALAGAPPDVREPGAVRESGGSREPAAVPGRARTDEAVRGSGSVGRTAAGRDAAADPPTGPRVRRPERPDLEVRGLTFAYGPRAAPVLDRLDLTVPYGDHVAVVGASGIGKSTLAGLLAGIETPGAGTVLLGGTPVGEVAEAERCRLLVLVPQDPYVFPGTLRDNVRYLAPSASDAALDRASEAVGLGPVLGRLGGWDAVLVRPEAELSAGERQLVVLARAFASPAGVVVLDEATCHLDLGAEARVERAFAERPGSLVVVAHRLSSAVRARRVLLLDGDRVALAPHARLLATSSSYARLFGVGAADAPRAGAGR
jgi:ATP-binding cassette subfamily C protein